MKNSKIYSLVVATGILAVVLPAVASDNSSGGTLREPYVADSGTVPNQGSSSTTPEVVDFSQLPAPVKATVQAQRGTDVISKIQLETRNGKKVYCVKFQNHADKERPGLMVSTDGKIVKEKTTKPSSTPPVADAPGNR